MGLLTLGMGKKPSVSQAGEPQRTKNDKVLRFDEAFAAACSKHRELRQYYFRPSLKTTEVSSHHTM
jgi:hypothetical protein